MKNSTHRCMAALVLALVAGVGQATTFYWAGGTTDIPNGTPIPTNAPALCGVWNTTTKNWATDTNGTTYVAWPNTPDAWAYLSPFATNATAGATITQTVNVVANRITADLSKLANTVNYCYYTITATSSRTLTLAGATPSLDVLVGAASDYLQFNPNVQVAGTNGFTRNIGNGIAQFASDSSAVSGTVYVLSGNASGQGVTIPAGGNLRNVSEFDCRGGWLNVTAATNANNQLGDAAIVRLRSNQGLTYKGYRGTGSTNSTETISQIALSPAGILQLSAVAGGSGPNGKLYLAHPTAGIDRGQDGKGALMVQGDSSDLFETDVVVSNGVPTGVILPWMCTLAARPVQVDPVTGVLEPLAVTTAPSDLSTWTNGGQYRIESNYVPANTLATLAINSLGIYNTNGAFSMSITPGNTLTVSSGLIAYGVYLGGGARAIANGNLTSGTNELDFITGNSSLGASISLNNCVLSGNMSVVKAGYTAVSFDGTATNTYTGTTYVNYGTFTLNRPAQASIPGNVIIGYGGNLVVGTSANTPINTNANITIRQNGSLTMNDGAIQTYSGIMTLDGGSFLMGQCTVGNGATLNHAGTGLIFTNGGTIRQSMTDGANAIYLLTDVRCEATSSNQALITTTYPELQTSEFLDLTTANNPATRTFNVARGVGMPSTTNDLVIDIPLRDATAAPALLAKAGTGVMSLERYAGLFSGGAVVTGGTLLVDGPMTTQTVETATTTNGTSLLTGLSTTNGLRIGQMVTGPGIPARMMIKSIDSASQVTMSTSATGTYTASQRVFYASSAAGTGGVLVAVAGTLGGSSGVVGPVTVNAGGTLAPGTLTNAIAAFTIIGKLDLSGGGTLAIDLASDTVGDRVVVLGNAVLGGTLAVNPVGGYVPHGGTGPWTILTTTGTVTGAFASKPAGYIVTVGSQSVTLSRAIPGSVVIFR